MSSNSSNSSSGSSISRSISNFQKLAQSRGGFNGHVIAFDPGERTGYAYFNEYELIEAGEVATGTVGCCFASLAGTVNRILKDHIIKEGFANGTNRTCTPALGDILRIAIEDYRIYSWKAADHTWSQVHTIKVVALAELIALQLNVPYRLRIAQHAKIFATDERLKAWGFWQKGQRHARDAIRHACLYICDPKNEVGK